MDFAAPIRISNLGVSDSGRSESCTSTSSSAWQAPTSSAECVVVVIQTESRVGCTTGVLTMENRCFLNLFRSRGLNELVASLTKRKAAAPRKLLGGMYSMNSVLWHLRMSCTCWHDQDIWNRREDTYAVEDPVRQVGRCTSDVSFFDASCRSKPVLKCS